MNLVKLMKYISKIKYFKHFDWMIFTPLFQVKPNNVLININISVLYYIHE